MGSILNLYGAFVDSCNDIVFNCKYCSLLKVRGIPKLFGTSAVFLNLLSRIPIKKKNILIIVSMCPEEDSPCQPIYITG